MWGVSGLSAHATVFSKGTCLWESQDYPLARGHLPEGHAIGSLRTIRLRQRNFQRDMLRGVSGLCARASAPSKVTCCEKSQDNPFPLKTPSAHGAALGFSAFRLFNSWDLYLHC